MSLGVQIPAARETIGPRANSRKIPFRLTPVASLLQSLFSSRVMMSSSRFRLSDDTTLTFTRAMVKFEQSEEEAENPPDYRGMRALQQQYQWSHECLDAGGDAYMQGKYRHAVNLFVAAYRQSGGSSGEFSFRYYCVVMVTNALTHAGLDAGERDIKFLKDIMNDEKEEHASRVRAAVVLGTLPSPH